MPPPFGGRARRDAGNHHRPGRSPALLHDPPAVGAGHLLPVPLRHGHPPLGDLPPGHPRGRPLPDGVGGAPVGAPAPNAAAIRARVSPRSRSTSSTRSPAVGIGARIRTRTSAGRDRKSTRLNSSHITISYAVFCL